MTPLPPLPAYNNAVATPAQCFFDSELRMATPMHLSMGLPMAMAGGFAATFHLKAPTREVAVRCFHRQSRHIEQRYTHICNAINAVPSPHFVKVDYLPQGIRVEGRTYPIVRMDWVRGRVFSDVVRSHHSDRHTLVALMRQLLSIERELDARGLAHGDLQPDNLIWDGSSLRMLDYDGMYVPGMPIGSGTERGHRNYQHPLRTADHFGPSMDRFSLIVLMLSLRALLRKPCLYAKYATTGENLLFTEDDYRDPGSSPLFRELHSLPEISASTLNFARICRGDPASVPSLSEFRAGRITAGAPAMAPTRRSLAVVEAADYRRAATFVVNPDPITVIGDVQAIRYLKNGLRLHLADPHAAGIVITVCGPAFEYYKCNRCSDRNYLIVDAPVYEVRRKRLPWGPEQLNVHLTVTRDSDIRLVTEATAQDFLRSCQSTDDACSHSSGKHSDAVRSSSDHAF